jgi:hypothetical protein
MFTRLCVCLVGGEWQMLLRANNLLPNSPLKPARVGARADDIGAKRLEEACYPEMAV